MPRHLCSFDTTDIFMMYRVSCTKWNRFDICFILRSFTTCCEIGKHYTCSDMRNALIDTLLWTQIQLFSNISIHEQLLLSNLYADFMQPQARTFFCLGEARFRDAQKTKRKDKTRSKNEKWKLKRGLNSFCCNALFLHERCNMNET